jgi:hypothetical protein
LQGILHDVRPLVTLSREFPARLDLLGFLSKDSVLIEQVKT